MKTIIISCSGNFYGSEQVLYDYLSCTSNSYIVYVPQKSILYTKLKGIEKKHILKSFNTKYLKIFYLTLFLKLLFGSPCKIYINEAGHSKYILLLGKIFSSSSFIIHVRILEDTSQERWIFPPSKNVQLLSVSKFIKNEIPYPSLLIYDPFKFSNYEIIPEKIFPGRLIIGVIGRITITKGINRLIELVNRIDQYGLSDSFEFHLYGDVSPGADNENLFERFKKYRNIKLEGFEFNKELLYAKIDCILHLSHREALGRIYFESVNALKPLIGFNIAGIGEIGEIVNQNKLLIDPDIGDWAENMIEKLRFVECNFESVVQSIRQSKIKANDFFSFNIYKSYLDNLLRV